jgi:hemolysin III
VPEPAQARTPEWFNVASHGLGTLAALGGLALLLRLAESSRAGWAFGIYGLSLVSLLTASTLYHAMPGASRAGAVLHRVDHICIYLLIAGTYTPPCLLAVPPAWGIPLLVGVWAVGLAGVLLEILRPPGTRRLTVGLYVAMGWLALLALPALVRHLPWEGLLLIVCGGVVYTVGAVVYGTRRPDPWPRWLGFHGLWHLLVLLGCGLHFAYMALYSPVI